MKYCETTIGKIHINGIDGIITQQEYTQIYSFYKKLGKDYGVTSGEILSALAIIRFGINIGKNAKNEEAFESTHETIKLEIQRICELTEKYPEECKKIKT